VQRTVGTVGYVPIMILAITDQNLWSAITDHEF